MQRSRASLYLTTSMTVSPTARAWWRAGQAIAVLVLAGVLAGLFAWPALTLRVFWNAVVPLVPASLLVTPALWRNVCPLATTGMLLNRGSGARLTNGAVRWAGAAGIVLLFALVPARRFAFNLDGSALAVTVLAVLAAAAALSAVGDAKAGFCNAVCPVLPVERLYGHAPLLRLGNPRCIPCSLCTTRGCVDLGPSKAAVTSLGAGEGALAFLRAPFGLFAVAFPGFIAGYFTTTDVSGAEAEAVYLHVLAWSAGGAALLLGSIQLFSIDRRHAIRALAALSAGLYYWFAPLGATQAFGLGVSWVWVLRAMAGLLIARWAFRPVG